MEKKSKPLGKQKQWSLRRDLIHAVLGLSAAFACSHSLEFKANIRSRISFFSIL